MRRALLALVLLGAATTGCAHRTDYAPPGAPCIRDGYGRQIPAGSVCQPAPAAHVLTGYGATSCEVYEGTTVTYSSLRTCSPREIQQQQALPVGER